MLFLNLNKEVKTFYLNKRLSLSAGFIREF